MEREARQVLGPVLDAAGIGRCLLLGHSDGASIAAVYGALGDPRVAGLMLLAPHFFVEAEATAAIADIGARYAARLRAKLARWHADVDGAFFGWHDAWLDPGFRAFDLRWALRRIAVPTLIVQGEADPYGTMAQVDCAAAEIPAGIASLLLPGVGHAPQQEAAEDVIAAVAALPL